jgi:hypothetical protein
MPSGSFSVVKGSAKNGQSFEKIVDVVWSGDRMPNKWQERFHGSKARWTSIQIAVSRSDMSSPILVAEEEQSRLKRRVVVSPEILQDQEAVVSSGGRAHTFCLRKSSSSQHQPSFGFHHQDDAH